MFQLFCLRMMTNIWCWVSVVFYAPLLREGIQFLNDPLFLHFPDVRLGVVLIPSWQPPERPVTTYENLQKYCTTLLLYLCKNSHLSHLQQVNYIHWMADLQLHCGARAYGSVASMRVIRIQKSKGLWCWFVHWDCERILECRNGFTRPTFFRKNK